MGKISKRILRLWEEGRSVSGKRLTKRMTNMKKDILTMRN